MTMAHDEPEDDDELTPEEKRALKEFAAALVASSRLSRLLRTIGFFAIGAASLAYYVLATAKGWHDWARPQ